MQRQEEEDKLRLNYDILLRFDGSVLTYVVVTKDG
jgi:hypothetical protein